MRARALTALLALAGCASPQKAPGGGDLSGRRDGGGGDMSRGNADLAGADLAEPPDFATGADLAGADLASLPDLSPVADLSRLPDLVMACAPQTQPCDVICQNCGVNLKCGVSNTGMPACVATGMVPVGGACFTNGVDDCAPGAVCLSESQSQNLNLCQFFCRSDGDCKTGGKCLFTLNGTMPPLMVCTDPLVNCDPVKKSGCNSGSCYLVTPDGQTGCHKAGPGAECGACVTDYDCQAGFACFASTANCPNGGCAKLCHAGNNGDCNGGETCQPVQYDQQGDTWANWGVCT